VLVDLRSQWTAANAAPNVAKRSRTVADIATAWSVVVVLPLLASVTLQNGPKESPPRNDKPQAIIAQHWLPLPWDAQTAPKQVQGSAQVASTATRIPDAVQVAWNTTVATPLWQTVGLQSLPDSPPIRTLSYNILDRWFALSVDPLWQSVGLQSTSPPAPPPIRTLLYPVIDRWFATSVDVLRQTAGLQDGAPFVPPSPPPVQYPDIQAVTASWIPPDAKAVWGYRVIDLTVYNPPITEETFYTIEALWHRPRDEESAYPPHNVGQPSGVPLSADNPPFTTRHERLDIIVRAWDTEPRPVTPRITAIQSAVAFRRTLSGQGTGVGTRQTHGWV